MSEWTITGFDGINNMKDPLRLKEPTSTREGNFGSCELSRCINFDIDNNGSLIKREDSQEIFSKSFDAKLTQKLAGITFTAAGNMLRYTKPYSDDYDKKRSSILYAAPIVLIQEVELGMWVSTTEKIFFHSGRNPSVIGGFTQTAEYNFAAIMGTAEKVHATKLGIDNDGFVAVFATTRGICYGTQTGRLSNMSEGTYSYSPFQRGISHLKEKDGIVQYQVKIINEIEESFNEQKLLLPIDVDSQ